jgi:hypothetical protein
MIIKNTSKARIYNDLINIIISHVIRLYLFPIATWFPLSFTIMKIISASEEKFNALLRESKFIPKNLIIKRKRTAKYGINTTLCFLKTFKRGSFWKMLKFPC